MKRELLLLLVTGILIVSSSVAQGVDNITFTTNSGGPNRVWTSNEVNITLSGSTVTIVGAMPTGDPARPIQTITMRLRNFKPNDTYPKTFNFVNEQDARWQNFAGTTGMCNCQSGSLTITTIDPDGRMHGTFNWTCGTVFPSGNVVTTRITEGVVSGVIPLQLSLRVRPGKKFTENPDKEVTLSFTVSDYATDRPLSGATVVCLDNPLLIKKNYDVGVSDDVGSVKYTFKIPKDLTEKKTYALTFTARRGEDVDAATITQEIEVDPEPRYWYYKCGGVNVIEYDAGEGERWENVGEGSPIKKASGNKVIVNRFLTHEGGEFKIDTTPGSERVLYTGKLLCPDCADIGLPGGVFLEAESLLMTSASGNCDGILKLAAAKQTGLKIFGGAIKLQEVAFLPEWDNPGIHVKVSYETPAGNDVRSQCAKSNDPGSKGLAMSFNWRKNGIEKFGLEATNLGVGKAFCFNELAASYDWKLETLSFNARATFEEMLDKTAEIKTSFVFRGDTASGNENIYLKDFMLQSTSEAVCTPMPAGPLAAFCLKGWRVNAGFDTDKGVRKWNFGLTGIFKPTAEALAEGKFSWVKKWGDALGAEKPELFEMELGGKWEYPLSFSGKGLVKIAKIPFISVTRPWQVTMDATQKIDFLSGATLRGNIKMCHLGADDYFASLTDVGYSITFLPFEMCVSGKGALRIPRIGDEINEQGAAGFLKWARAFGVDNTNLGQGSVYLGLNEKVGFNFNISCDVSQNPVAFIRSYGKFFFDVKGTPADGLVIDWGRAFAARPIRWDRKPDDMIQANAVDTFAVTADIDRVIVLVSGETTAPASMLVDPNGVEYATTKSDSTIIRFDAANGSMTQWFVIDPVPGNWVVKLTDPKPEDELRISIVRKERPFTMQTSVSGRNLTVSWDPSAYAAGDIIALVLDENNEGHDGVALGEVDATRGTFTYAMSDSLRACSYYVSATRVAVGLEITSVYSDEPISTGKSILPPPTNVRAYQNTTDGMTTITWTPSSDPLTVAYVIYADLPGEDTVLGYAESYETRFTIGTPDLGGRSIYLVAVNAQNQRGCPSESILTVVSVDNDGGVAEVSSTAPIDVIPHPVHATARVIWNAPSPSAAHLRITNMVGATVAEFAHATGTAGMQDVVVDVSNLVPGTYAVSIISEAGMISRMFVVAPR